MSKASRCGSNKVTKVVRDSLVGQHKVHTRIELFRMFHFNWGEPPGNTESKAFRSAKCDSGFGMNISGGLVGWVRGQGHKLMAAPW